MAIISLRVYNREIEGLIEVGKMDQAIAHCKHILKTYSMHIETYQLLGKAYLEAHRYVDATDIFQRILNAVPDDFISHVGMSIIRDDEGKLNDAIWHMERAYEVQPSNPAIQGELRRLYGKRDGIEPAKIRLSREALANMYAQGELYNQAIAEIRAILTDDPDRPDLQVMLARAYFQTGQKVEATEMATHLLKKYPYCVDALRVLVEVLPGSTKTENIEVYRQRLKLLDPYSPYNTESVFHTEQVPDDSVAVEKLEYLPDTQSNLGQTAWANSLGIKLEDDSTQPAQASTEESAIGLPMDTAAVPAVPEQVSGDEPLDEEPQPPGWDEIPEQAETSIGTNEVEGEGLTKAEMPEWLRSQVPPEINEIENPAGITAEEESDFPDWLTSLSDEEIPTTPTQAVHPDEQAATISMPSDITETSKTDAEVPESETHLQDLPGSQGEKPGEEEEGIQTWLEKLAGGAVAGSTLDTTSTDEPTAIDESYVAEPQVFEEDLTLEDKDTSLEASDTIENEPPTKDEAMEAGVIGDFPATPEEGEQEEVIAIDKAKREDIPDWIRSMTEEPVSSSSSQPEKVAFPKENNEEAILDNKEKVNEQEDSATNIPEWLRQIDQERFTEPEGEAIEATPLIPPSDGENLAEMVGNGIQKDQESLVLDEASKIPSTTPEEDTTITAWLKKLDESTESKAQPPITQEEEIVTNSEEELPVWLRDLEKDKTIDEPSPESNDTPGGIETPDWLNQRLEPISEQPTMADDQQGKDVDWSEDEIDTGKEVTPTIPTEWIPEDHQEPIMPSAEALPSEPTIAQEALQIPTNEPSTSSTIDKDALVLTAAKDHVQAKHYEEAANEYIKLIKKGKYLDEATADLHSSLDQVPENVLLWQTLGDAYMRSNRLQDALDAYTKAEELLR